MPTRTLALAGALAVAAHLAAPVALRGAVDSVIVLTCAVACAAFVRRRELQRTPWALVPVGALVLAAGDTAFLAFDAHGTATVLWLAAYAPLGAAAWLLQRVPGQRQTRWTEDLLDAAVVLACAVVVWTWFLESTVAGRDPWGAAEDLSYAVLDGVLLLATVRLWRRGGGRHAAVRRLVVALALLLTADLSYGLSGALGSYTAGTLLDALYGLAAVALVGAVAVADRDAVADGPGTARPWIQLTVLGGALFAGASAALLLDDGPAQRRAAGVALVGVAALVARIVLLWRGMEEAHRQVRLTLERAHDPYLALNAEGVVRAWNTAAERTFGFVARDVLGRHLADLVPVEQREALLGWLGQVRAGDPAAGLGGAVAAEVGHADGRVVPVEVTLWTTRADGLIHLFLRDMSARLEHEDLLRRQALHDPLTGLANRALLADRLEHALAAMHRDGGTVGVALIDLDDFKQTNDTGGHQAGDAVLRAVADRLRVAVRATDTVARYGGDEFAVISSGLTGRDDAEVVARALRDALAAAPAIRASIGVATAADAASVMQLFACADLALYEAKRHGKDRWARYEPTLHATHRRRLRLLADLPGAIAEGAITVAYQPIVDGLTREIVAVEALARWTHPELGAVPPPEFIGVAEEEHLIGALGAAVLRRACQAVAALPEGPGGPVDVSVNVSARQMDEGFPAVVAAALADAGLPPTRLVLELTETLLVESLEPVVALMEAVRATGVRFAIDDFGTGYASMAALADLPVDMLKIDRQFVALATGDVHQNALARTALLLGESLDLTVVAEGVETEEQHARLVDWGCRREQGFLHGRPVSAEELGALLDRRPVRP